MKTSELMAHVNAGGIVCVGVFLSGRCETISVRDKATGGRRAAHVVKEICLTDNEPVVVSRWLKDNEKPEDYKVPFKKGAKVVIKVRPDGMNGIPMLSGSVEELV